MSRKPPGDLIATKLRAQRLLKNSQLDAARVETVKRLLRFLKILKSAEEWSVAVQCERLLAEVQKVL